MLSKFFEPVYHFGRPFDRAMTLIELDALREPERTQFPLIGKYLERRGIELVEVPTPKILWQRGMPYQDYELMPDWLISNHTKAWNFSKHPYRTSLHPSRKHLWSNEIDLEIASLVNHPPGMHDDMEMFCRKVTGLPMNHMVAKYHRAIWCCLYYPESLGTIFQTKFFYPKAGYVGVLAETLGVSPQPQQPQVDSCEITVAYCLATVKTPVSVLFIPRLHIAHHDGFRMSPIYRITDMDVCAGSPDADLHRLIVEYRGDCRLEEDLSFLGISLKDHSIGSGRVVPPTVKNVEAGYNFGRHLNSMILEGMNAKAV